MKYWSSFRYSLLAVTYSLGIALSSGPYQKFAHVSATKLSSALTILSKDFVSDPTDILKSSFIVSKEEFTFGMKWLLLPVCLGGDDSCIPCLTGLLGRKPH